MARTATAYVSALKISSDPESDPAKDQRAECDKGPKCRNCEEFGHMASLRILSHLALHRVSANTRLLTWRKLTLRALTAPSLERAVVAVSADSVSIAARSGITCVSLCVASL